MQDMTEDQDTQLFVDQYIDPQGNRHHQIHLHEQRDLVNHKGFLETDGYVQICCDLPASVSGQKPCHLVDYRATLHCADDAGRPLMLIQQMKGKDGKGSCMQKKVSTSDTSVSERRAPDGFA